MGNEEFYIKKWKCTGINYIMTDILSFIRLPALLLFIGIENNLFFELGIGFFGIGLHKKLHTSKKIKKLFESVSFTISYTILTITLLLYLVVKNHGTYQKSRN